MLKGDSLSSNFIDSQFNNHDIEIRNLQDELDNEIHLRDHELHKLTQRILNLEIIVGVSIASLVSMFYLPVQTVLIIQTVLLLILAIVPWGLFTGIARGVTGFIQLFVAEIAEAWKFYRLKGDDDE